MFSNGVLGSNLFGDRFDYLPEGDRTLFPKRAPEYRFNIIGAGMMGMEHIRVTLLDGRAGIKGIYDSSPKSLKVAKALCDALQPEEPLTIYRSLEEACTDPGVDALIICTPNSTHLEIMKEAVKSEKPILLEKPMATTLKDAYEIFRISENYPSFINVGLQYRYKAIYREAFNDAVEHRSIGALKILSITEHRLPFLDKVGQWNKFSRFSGGTLVEKCCHYFDLLNLFAQSKPIRVSGIGSAAVNFRDFAYQGKGSDILDNAFITVEYENGINASFALCMFSPMFHEEFVLCGDEGRIRAYETEDFLPGKALKTGFEMKCSNGLPAKESELHYPGVIEGSGHNGSTFFEHHNFIEGMRGNTTDSATLREGLRSIVVGVAAEEAVRTKGAVEIEGLLERHDIENW